MYATMGGHLEMIQFLEERGINLKEKNNVSYYELMSNEIFTSFKTH